MRNDTRIITPFVWCPSRVVCLFGAIAPVRFVHSCRGQRLFIWPKRDGWLRCPIHLPFLAHCVPRYTRGPSSRGYRIVFATTLRFLSVAMHCFWVSSCAFPTLSTGVFLLGMSAILADLRLCRVGGRMPIRFGGSSGSRASGPLPGGFGLGFVKAACIALSGVTLLSAECFLQPV